LRADDARLLPARPLRRGRARGQVDRGEEGQGADRALLLAPDRVAGVSGRGAGAPRRALPPLLRPGRARRARQRLDRRVGADQGLPFLRRLPEVVPADAGRGQGGSDAPEDRVRPPDLRRGLPVAEPGENRVRLGRALQGPGPRDAARRLPARGPPLGHGRARPDFVGDPGQAQPRDPRLGGGDAQPRGAQGRPMRERSSSGPEPLPSVVTVANVVYALHALAILVGIAGSAGVIGSFGGSVPSIAAVILNYLKRRDARGTWLESHYRWQIRTFWYALLWLVLAAAPLSALMAIPVRCAD